VFSVATAVVVHPRATVCEGIPGRLVYRCCVDAWRLGDVNVRLYLFHLFITGVALRCQAEQKERWAAIASPGRTGETTQLRLQGGPGRRSRRLDC